MPPVTREVAKFLAGYAAAETIGHWWMGTWGRRLLPMDLGWFTFTRGVNTFAMTFWPLVLAGLVYLGWYRRPVPAVVAGRAAPGRRAAA
jgi:hypothetical protein